jgi:hypothetical protein
MLKNTLKYKILIKLFVLHYVWVGPSGRAVYDVGLRPLACWGCGFESQRGKCCECCVLSGRSLCDELITRPEESYWLWCVVLWTRNLVNEVLHHWGWSRHKQTNKLRVCMLRVRWSYPAGGGGCVIAGHPVRSEPIHRVFKKSQCTWWLQYKKHPNIF